MKRFRPTDLTASGLKLINLALFRRSCSTARHSDNPLHHTYKSNRFTLNSVTTLFYHIYNALDALMKSVRCAPWTVCRHSILPQVLLYSINWKYLFIPCPCWHAYLITLLTQTNAHEWAVRILNHCLATQVCLKVTFFHLFSLRITSVIHQLAPTLIISSMLIMLPL